MRKFRAACAALILFLGCASTQTLEVLEADTIYSRGMAALESGDWDDALLLFERLSLEYPLDPRVEESRFRMGEAYIGKKEYIIAANEFARLAAEFPGGSWADDSRFKVCESYFLLSPTYQLDQEYTTAAIDHCESLVGYYPDSEFVPRAQEIAAELTNKLAEKTLAAGEFYLRRRAYDSALIYFDHVVTEYPRAAVAPRALLRTFEAYRALCYQEEMEAARSRLLTEYPASPEAREVQATSVANSP